MSGIIDWGGDDWWAELPPPPNDDNGGDGSTWEEDHGWSAEYIPPVPIWFEFNRYDPGPDDYLPESAYDAWDFLRDISQVDPATIRGIAFTDIHEALDWLQSIGLVGFGSIVYSEGFYYPAIDYKDPEQPGEVDTGDDSWEFDEGLFEW